MSAVRIMIVEDEVIFAENLASRLNKLGYDVCGKIVRGEDAADAVERETPDLVLMDIRLKGEMDGIQAAREIRHRTGTPVIFLTALADDSMIERTKEAAPYAYLVKPVRERELQKSIETALCKFELESKLMDREALLRTIVVNSPNPVAVLDLDGRIILVSHSFLEAYGVEEAVIWGMPYEDVFPGISDTHRRALAGALAGRVGKMDEDTWTRPDGAMEWVSWEVQPWWGRDGTVWGVVCHSRIITGRKKAQMDLVESENRYRSLIRNAPLGIVTIDTEGRVLDINPKLAELLGAPERDEARAVNFLSFPPLVSSGLSKRLEKCLEKDEPDVFEVQYSMQGNGVSWHRYHIRPQKSRDGRIVGVHAVAEDITTARKLEIQLRQAHKMEAVGTLAGGIAHDFNNILAAILGNAELARLEIGNNNPAHNSLKQVFRGALQAKELVRQILTFSRQAAQVRQPVELGPIIKDGLRFLRASLPASIEIVYRFDAAKHMIKADPTQIHQMLMNLCSNAAAAVGSTDGRIEVEVSTVLLDEDGAERIGGLEPGQYQRLSVIDNGGGMDETIRERVFEPFFTTREPGEGTGMGLAVVHGIVTGHGGVVTVESTPGEGTAFRVWLPVIEPWPQDSPGVEIAPPRGKGERILFLDDEKPLIQLTRMTLDQLGYKVECFWEPTHALEEFRRRPDDFDLVITDLTMPRMTGDRVAMEMMRIKPGLSVILCTGFSEMLVGERALEMGLADFIVKPFEAQDLAVSIRNALDRNQGAFRVSAE